MTFQIKKPSPNLNTVNMQIARLRIIHVIGNDTLTIKDTTDRLNKYLSGKGCQEPPVVQGTVERHLKAMLENGWVSRKYLSKTSSRLVYTVTDEGKGQLVTENGYVKATVIKATGVS